MKDERERVEDWSPYTCRIDTESNVQIRPGQYQASSAVLAWILETAILCNGLALHAICFVFTSVFFHFYTSQDHTKTHNSRKSGEDEEREEEETEEEEAEKLQKAREWDEFKDGESNTYDFMASRQCSTVAKCRKVHKRFNLRTLNT